MSMPLVVMNSTTVALQLPATMGASQASAFRDAIRAALARVPRELLLDCAGVTYIDSTGLGLLALAQGEASKLGCTLKLANVLNAHVRNLLTLMQYDQLFPLVSVRISRTEAQA
jgi:anti-anti-sigma factor